MKCFIGIDLGSTTTKAVLMTGEREVLGRGITNSRSNYGTATRVAKQEAVVSARLSLLRRGLSRVEALAGGIDDFVAGIERAFRLEQFVEQLRDLERTCMANVEGPRFADNADDVKAALVQVFMRLYEEAPALFAPGAERKSDFFRDIAGSRYLAAAEAVARDAGMPYELLLHVYDKSIIDVENRPPSEDMIGKLMRALDKLIAGSPDLEAQAEAIKAPVGEALGIELEETYVVGTGYGRARLPFSKEHIRSP